jgi:hypothetical protein
MKRCSVCEEQPVDSDSPEGDPPDGALSHYDNIHNHRLPY